MISFVLLCIGCMLVRISICGNDGTFDETDVDTLLCVHAIFRHGDRNIEDPYATDPNKDESNWPGGFGQLTKTGKMQEYELGRYFRRRYGKMLGDKYSPKKVYVQSTEHDRTMMSALLALAGLFPPTEEEVWNQNLQWQPIPVHVVPLSSDNVMLGARNCPKYDNLYNAYVNESPEVQQIHEKYGSFFKYLTRMCGQNVTSIGDACEIHDTMKIEKDRNKILPEWVVKVLGPNSPLKSIALFNFKMAAGTPQMARLKCGFLFAKICKHLTDKKNSTLNPNRSLWMYSGHDSTISNMLNALGLFDNQFVPFGACLLFELYKSNKRGHYVQIRYRKANEENPTPMKIPNCTADCPLDRFLKLYKYLIADDVDTECQSDVDTEWQN